MNKIHAQCAHTHPYINLSLSLSKNIRTLLKMEFEGGQSYWNFILKFHFCHHAFSMINIPHHSMSLASRWKLNTCAWLRRSQAHIRLKQHMCRDGIPPKIALPSSYSGGAKRKYFLTSAQGLLRHVTLQFHLWGWITIPGFPSKKKWNSTAWFLPPPPPSPSRGVGI